MRSASLSATFSVLLALLACGGGGVALEQSPLASGRASGTVPWSGRIKAGTLDAVEVGVFESAGVARQHWLGAVAGPKGPVLFHVTVRHIKEPGPRREYLFWRRLLGSLEAKP